MLGKRKLARERPMAPAGFLETCQPTLAKTPPKGSGWLHEVKHDGYRLIARAEHEGKRVRLWSRNGTYTDHFTAIRDAVAAIGIDCVLDGEAVVFHQDGHSDFDALRSKEASSQAMLVAFDVRRALLSELLAGAPGDLVLSEFITGDGGTVFRGACEMALEGIVSKRLGSTYRAGRSPDWVKVKNPGWVRR
jgi:bifunctional non-homologous end joining protein LigD